MKKANSTIIASIFIIALAVSVVSVAGTIAYLNDTETVGQNVLTAGTLDLTVNGENPSTVHITFDNMKPGDESFNEFTLKNIGSLSGTITVEISAIVNYENGRSEPEIEAGDTTSAPLSGELGANLEVWCFSMRDVGGDWHQTVLVNAANTLTLHSGGAVLDALSGETLLVPQPDTYDLSTLEPDEEQICTLLLKLPTDISSIIQGDSVVFSIIFHLDQA